MTTMTTTIWVTIAATLMTMAFMMIATGTSQREEMQKGGVNVDIRRAITIIVSVSCRLISGGSARFQIMKY